MSGLSLVAELTASRLAACKPPKGTPSCVLANRWNRRSSLYQRSPAAGTRFTPTPPTAGAWPYLVCNASYHSLPFHRTNRHYSTWKDFAATSSTLSPDDLQFLTGLIQHHGHQLRGSVPYSGLESILLDSQVCSNTAATGERKSAPLDSTSQPVDPMGNLHHLFRGALKAMQWYNSRELLITLKKITEIPQNELVEAVATLPRTTFSEFLRSLDPIQIGRDNDPTHGVVIGPGVWQVLNLGAVLDEYGIRVLYTRLLQQMLVLMRALKANGQILSINDYIPLFRAAGVTSDTVVAKLLWEQMKTDDIWYWKTTSTYLEYIKARFLVDPAYYSYDKSRYVVDPGDLHRRRTIVLKSSVARLDKLKRSRRRKGFKFGLNRDSAHAEDLMNILRRPLPARRMFFFVQKYGVRMTEQLICSFMVAFGRAGALRFIQDFILEDYFGIVAKKEKTDGRISVSSLGVKPRSSGGGFYRPARPFLVPTAKLVETVVYTYCSNGQLSMAFNIVDFISNKYNIPISENIWFELLEWAYILSTPPISKTWKMSRLEDRVPSQNAVEIIWNTMTAPPYNFRPGFKQYNVLVKSLLGAGKVVEALKKMREARPLYEKQYADYETAAVDYAAAQHAGVDSTRELRAFQRARFLKSYMRQRMNLWCNTFLEKKFRPRELHDPMATSGIPKFVREWRGILTNPVRYRTASGYIDLHDPAEAIEQTMFVRQHIIETPVKKKGEWALRRVFQRQWRLLSEHAVGDLLSSRVDPLAILKGIPPKGRPSLSRRRDKYLAWKAAGEQAMALVSRKDDGDVTGAQTEGSSEEDIWNDDDDDY
ncbi:putative Mitochondrial ATPase expression-domain-containing protein [Seiridium cardinale]|uniref:Mitochondrial ATPase expression-domain-containing protein n=1 Tax=Seiridium cardinale TaxID=138064 RepID=A0ABR2Y8Q6_9PEZI